MSTETAASHLHFDCALLPDGRTAAVDIEVVDGLIASLVEGEPRDPSGLVAMPGMVDLHGDAIEHPLMPRPGVGMPVDVALYDTDRRLAGNGITTALHGLTCSWEPGLRSVATIDAVLDGLERLGDGLWVDHRIHLRFESHALDAVEDARRWLADGRVDLVSINRHFQGLFDKIADSGEATPLAKRSGLDIDDYRALMAATSAREAEVEAVVAAVFAAAAEHGVARASHDDRTVAEREAHRAYGAAIVDFPLGLPAAVLAGYDWGGRAVCVAAAAWPERVHGLVSVNGYLIQDIAASMRPLPPRLEAGFWYFFYFLTERGRAGLAADPRGVAEVIWRRNSPEWSFTDAELDLVARSFANPDYADVVIHSYRHRLGAAEGAPRYAELERALAGQPAIPVPAITLDGGADGNFPATDGTAAATHFTGPREHRIVPGAGHNLPRERPEAFARAVLDVGAV